MVAKRTARVTLTVLVAFAVVTSVVAAPVSAGDDSLLDDGDDDDPVGVSADNDSVSVSAGDDGVTVGSDGVDADADDATGDVTDAVSDAGATDGASGAETTDPPVEPPAGTNDDLPVNYSDVPFWVVPVDLCRGPPEAPDAPDLPVDNPTPVDPTDPPGAPFTQCDVFNPYEPPFDPTQPPTDPDANAESRTIEVGPEGIHIVASGSADGGDGSPGDSTTAGVKAGEDDVGASQYTAISDGSRNYVVYTRTGHEPGTREGEAGNDVSFLGKSAGANIVCDGEACYFTSDDTPAPNQEIPTNRSNDGDGPAFPCEAPVSPDDLPDPPADPSNPPEPLPPVENPTPLDPTDPPNPPLGPCDLYDPNDPPSASPDPDHSYGLQPGENNTVARATGTYNDSDGPTASTIAGASQDPDRPGASQRTYLHDGQKSTVVYTTATHESGSRKGSLMLSFSSTKRAKLIVDCDGEECTVEVTNTPLPSQSIPTNRSGDSDGDAGPAVPCEPPVGPGDAPDAPVDPSNPPEPLPPVENPTPLDPTDPPNPPLGACDVYDPNDPPSASPNPDHSYDASPGQNGSVARATGTFNESDGPTASTIAGTSQEADAAGASQRTYLHDGQKHYVVYTGANGDPTTLTEAGLAGVPFHGDSFVVVDAFGKRAEASAACDGEFCTVGSGSAPVDDQRVRISSGSDSDGSSTSSSSTSSSTDSTSSSTDSGSSTTGGASDSSQSATASSDAAGSVSSAADRTATGAAADLPRAVNAGTTGIPSAFRNGLPDAASASQALLNLV